jgi:hypothetical protein
MTDRVFVFVPNAPYDFVQDRTQDGRAFRMLTVPPVSGDRRRPQAELG